MLRLLGLFFKTAVFGFIVLMLGNFLRWDGRTLSQHVDHLTTRTLIAIKGGKAQADVKSWARSLASDAELASQKMKGNSAPASLDDVTRSERGKLRSLIQELNRSQSAPKHQ